MATIASDEVLPAMTLTADDPSPYVGSQVVLTAASSVDATAMPYFIYIADTDGNTFAACSSGTTCQTAVSMQTVTTRHYIAWVGNRDGDITPTNLQTSVGSLAVTWSLRSISLTSSDTSAYQLQSVVLTAASTFDVTSTPYYIYIADTTSGSFAVCGSGTTCQVTVARDYTTTDSFIAWVGNRNDPLQPTNLQTVVSSPVAVSWSPAPVSLSSRFSDLYVGTATTVSASSWIDVTTTPYYIYLLDTDSGQFAACATGNTCQGSFSASSADTHHFVAWVGYRSASNAAVNVQAGLSPAISVTWHAGAALLSSGAESCADPYTPPNSNPVQVCVAAATTQTTLRVVRTVSTKSLQDAGAVPAPDWCSIDGQNFVIYRTEACGVFSGVLTVRDLNSGEVTGTMDFDYVDYAYSETDLSDWGHQVSVRVVSESGDAEGSSVQGDASCENSCQVDRADFPVQALSEDTEAEGTSFLSTTVAAAGSLDYSQADMSLTFSNPAWGTSNAISSLQAEIRCDNAVPGLTTVGCIFPDNTPVMTYSLSGPYPELASHILRAQQSGLGGSEQSGVPLHRATSQSLKDRNRARACPPSYLRPANKSCDEYPFASSYEGASQSGGGPRTFDGCSITLPGPPSTGPTGYSVCMIDKTQNSLGGLALNDFFKANRIIDEDAYWLDIEG